MKIFKIIFKILKKIWKNFGKFLNKIYQNFATKLKSKTFWGEFHKELEN